MDETMELVASYEVELEKVNQYETPEGVTFVKERNFWYNNDDPRETLTTKELAERCAEEEIND